MWRYYVFLLIIVGFIHVTGKLTRSATSGHSDPALPVVHKFLAGGQYAMLTFSNGPHFRTTSQILDVLADKKAHGTFFVSGHKATANAAVVARIAKEGHDVGMQGYHLRPIHSSSFDNQRAFSLNATAAKIESITGLPVKFFRPPSGSDHNISDVIHQSTGLRAIMYNIDETDSLGKLPESFAEPSSIVKAIMSKVEPGSIINIRDTHPHWVKVLPLLIDELHAKGFELLTISQMMKFPDDAPH